MTKHQLDIVIIVGAVLFALCMLFMLFITARAQHDCEDRGGVYIRQALGYRCVMMGGER